MRKPPQTNRLIWIVAGGLILGGPVDAQDAPLDSAPDTAAQAQVKPVAHAPAPAAQAPELPILMPDELPPPAALADLFNAKRELPEQKDPAKLLADVGLPEEIADPQPRPDPPLAGPLQALIEQAEQAAAQGRFFEAIRSLREAQRLAPTHPRVLRELALAYANSGNRVRAQVDLLQAARHDPTDREVLLLLARYALEQGDPEETLEWCKALDQTVAGDEDRDTAVLADYLRAQAFDAVGQYRAAIQLYQRVLGYQPDLEKQASAVGREWTVIDRRRSALNMRLGDLLLLDGRPNPQAAQAAYAWVDAAELGHGPELTARQVYVHLLLRDAPSAIAFAAERLARPATPAEEAGIIDYLLDCGVPKAAIAEALRKRYDEQPDSTPLLAGLGRVLPQDQTLALAERSLAEPGIGPEDYRMVLELLGQGLAATDDPQTLRRLLELTATAVQAQPGNASVFADIFFEQPFDPVTMIRALQRQQDEPKSTAVMLYLIGRGYHAVNRSADAEQAYRAALDLDEDQPQGIDGLRVALATLLLDQAEPFLALSLDRRPRPAQQIDAQQMDRAQRLVLDAERALGSFDPAVDWDTYRVWIRLYKLQGQQHRTQQALDARARLLGLDSPMRVLRSSTMAQIRRMTADAALRDLRQVIAQQPDYLPAYEAALTLVDENLSQFDQPMAAFEQRQQVVADLITNLPESQLAMLEQARLLLSEREDLQPAIDLLERMIEKYPKDQSALYTLYSIYDEQGDEERANQVYLKLVEAGEPGIVRRVDLCRYYLRVQNAEAMLEVIQRTLAEEAEGVLPGPPLTGDLAASLLAPLSLAGVEDEAETLYLQMVRRFPDSARLNNGLGYRWATQNRNLRQAKTMIERAIQAEGENSAYLDSLAWVYYKMGDFARAEAYQRQALELLRAEQLRLGEQLRASKAVLYDHMGDILYHNGDANSAKRHWQIARAQRVPPEEIATDPELADLQERVQAKITAVSEGQVPPTAAIPGEEALGPEGHPADLPIEQPAPEPAAQP